MLNKYDLLYPGRRVSFVDSILNYAAYRKTDKGLTESDEYLTRMKVKYSNRRENKFYTRAIIRPGIEDIADIIFEQLSSQELLEEGVQKVKK